nr:hypothetical protein [Nanoarchaeota archaeon]
MGNEEKYFGVFGENSNRGYLFDDTIKRVIDKVNKRIRTGVKDAKSDKELFYKPPIPEKTLPHKKENSLDDVIKKVNKIPSQSSPSHPTSKSTSSGSSYNKPNPFKYLGDRIISDIKETLIPDPRDSVYVTLKRLAPVVLGKPSNGFEEKLSDIVTIIFYKVIDDYISKR